MAIRLEGQGSELIALTYAGSDGRFAFRDVTLRTDALYYIVADVEGFEPYRDRLDRQIDLRFGGHLTVILERPTTTVTRESGGPYVVDARYLLADVPKEAVREYEQAVEESEKGHTERSIEHLQKALERAPDYAEAHNHLGRQYLTLERMEEARAEFERARELNPPWVIPTMNLGTLFYLQGEAYEMDGEPGQALQFFTRAVDVLEEAVRIDPLSPMAHHLLGTALYKTSDYSEAESMQNRALALNPDLGEAQISLVNIYSRQRRYAEALETVNAYLKRHPKGPEAASLQRVREQLETALR